MIDDEFLIALWWVFLADEFIQRCELLDMIPKRKNVSPEHILFQRIIIAWYIAQNHDGGKSFLDLLEQ